MDNDDFISFCEKECNESICSDIGSKLPKDTAAIAFISPIVPAQISPSQKVRASIEIPEEFGIEDAITNIKEQNINKLYLLINSFGGGVTSSYKIARMIRDNFDEITVFIPHYAASGGTMLALTGDKIIMGEMSSLSPTDIQIFVGNGMYSVNTYINAFWNFTKLFSTKSEEDAPYPWKAMANKLDPLEFQACIDATRFSTIYAKSILNHKNSSLSDRAERIIRDLGEGFPAHEYAITIEKAKELIGNDVVLHFREDDKYLSIWNDMRSWLRQYLMEESPVHFIRYIFPSKSKRR